MLTQMSHRLYILYRCICADNCKRTKVIATVVEKMIVQVLHVHVQALTSGAH